VREYGLGHPKLSAKTSDQKPKARALEITKITLFIRIVF
jgi:hypothetical protein